MRLIWAPDFGELRPTWPSAPARPAYSAHRRVLYRRRKGETVKEYARGGFGGEELAERSSDARHERKWKNRRLRHRCLTLFDWCALYVHHAVDLPTDRLEYRLEYITDRYAPHAFYWQVRRRPLERTRQPFLTAAASSDMPCACARR